MIGHRRVVITASKAGVGNFPYRRVAIAPFGVHLQVAAVLLKRRTRDCGNAKSRRYSPTTALTSAYVRDLCTAITRTLRYSTFESGASAGPAITSPVGLNRDP